MMATALEQPPTKPAGTAADSDSGVGASITPPQSANGKKEAPEGVPSELSDLELDQKSTTGAAQPSVEGADDADGNDDDDGGEIEPDHYYGGGKIPVFKPTMDQFRDFQKFINKVDKYGMQSGIVKVIPPKEWSDVLPSLDEAIKKIRVKNPIMQEFHGSHGTYTQANIEKQRSYNLPQWKALCEESSHQPPARRGERRRNQDRARAAPAQRSSTPRDAPKRRPGPGRPPKRQSAKVKEEPQPDDTGSILEKTKPEGPPTPVSPESHPVQTKTEELSEGESLPAPKPKGRQPKSVAARRKTNKGDMVDYIDEEAFQGFDYRIHDNEKYTHERCEELETAYWKSLMFNNPMYGADMPGSLFDENITDAWNVAKLPNLLDVLGQKVPGVNTAYLYLGMWKATFAWHLEDVDLYSINYIHFGAPKQWYSISQEDAPRFEQAMKSIWPSDAKNCDQFLRHKTYLVSPSLLKSQYGITVNKMVHYEGEFVITYPYGYHSGFNIGYNCAESVNFATDKWLDYGRIAKKCHCEADSVWIDVDEIERKLRGESTPDYFLNDYEMMSDMDDGASDLLTPPRSVPEKSAATRGRKRKHPDGDLTRTKRLKLHLDAQRRIPCLLCPNDLEYEDLLPTENRRAHAHRRCAEYIEETSVLRDDDSGTEVVCDVDKVPKARMGLKCLYCREVRGACFQCNYGKCTRAYHATCALLAGVQAEQGAIAVIADDGRQYSIPSVDLKCKYHRQKRHHFSSSSYDSYYADRNDRKLLDTARGLVPGDLVQFQADKEITGAVVLDNRPDERTLQVKALPRGDVLELPYRWMLVVRKSNFTPLTAEIQPLPAHLSRKPESRSQVDASQPVAGSAFGPGYEWAEFETVNDAGHVWVPPAQAQRQIWYYLGSSSTECRAQYTHNPSVPVHNPRANFLDSVRSLGALQAHSYSQQKQQQQQQQQQKHHRYPVAASAPGIGALRCQQPPSTITATTTAATATTAAAAAPLQNNFLAPPLPTSSASSRSPLLQQQRPLAPPPLHHQNPLFTNGTTSTITPTTTTTTTTTTSSSNTNTNTTATSSSSLPSSSSSLDSTSAPPVNSAMPSAYRSLPSQSARHAPYPSVTTKSQRQLQLQKQQLQQQQQYLSNNTNQASDPLSSSSSSAPSSTTSQQPNHAQSNTFANVRELIARRRLAQITDHANVFAGYTIVSPELVVETLLGPMGTLPPSNALEKLELAMAQQRVQPRAMDGTLLPLQPLNMRSEEVNRLLQMLRFSLVSHRERLDVLQKKESESPATATATGTTTSTTNGSGGGSGNGTNGSLADTVPADRPSVTANKVVAGKYAFLDQQRSQAPAVYRSPYDHPSGFTKYAEETYGLIPNEPEGPKPSLANDYFASLSQTDQEKIMKTCGSYVQRAIERSTSHSRSGSASNFRLSSALAQQQTELSNPTIDITTVDDLPTTTLAGLDLPLHADSPCSSFSRSHLRFQSPNDFTSNGGIGAGMGMGMGMGMGIGAGVDAANPDHHDLFGDQQANTRFWQHGPWAAGDGNTPNEENRPFFGPHERLKNDYASSDISLGRGPGSLHSADMAGFGLDGTDDICAELSP